MRAFLLLIACTASALALTPQERQIAEQMRDRITSLRADLDAREETVLTLTGTLQAQSLETVALTQDLRKEQLKVESLVAERDSLKAELSRIALQLEEANQRISDLGKTIVSLKAEAKQNARERDVLVFAFAIAFSALAVRIFGPMAAAAFPQYSFLTGPAIAVAGIAGGYAVGRIILRYLSHLIP